MEGIVLVIHILVCVLLVVIVLLQSGKSADLAGAFGGVGSQSTFGPRGTATILSKMTTTLAILFMVTSLTLWIIAAKKGGTGTQSEMDSGDVKQEQTTTTGDQAAEEKAGTETTETDKAADKTDTAEDTGKAGETKTDDTKTGETKTEDKKAEETKTQTETKESTG